MEGPLPEALQNTGLFQDQWPEGTSSTQKGASTGTLENTWAK